jgi:predicted transcriptional regulator
LYYIDITKAILNVLQKLNKPIEVDEIAFRIRSTSTIVMEQLEKLAEAHMVRKSDAAYSIEDTARKSGLALIYSH